MLSGKLKHLIHLHILVFIAGFTAILGKLISLESIALVWFRMLFALVLMYLYLKFRAIHLKVTLKSLKEFCFGGIIIALHWVTFFESINQSNVSIALAMFSSGAFFASIIEPLILKRQLIWYEIIFGIIVVIGVSLIFQSEYRFINGILLGILSAFFSSLFAVFNGKLIKTHKASVISFYEFVFGVIFLSVLLFFNTYNSFSFAFFDLNKTDLFYLFILASVCTAYAFIAATHVMKYVSPYTVVLTYNLEPIYGILMALYLFGDNEKMSIPFYVGALIIIATVLANGFLKSYEAKKRKHSVK